MGHFYPRNLSEIMYKLALMNGSTTGNEVIEDAIRRGELVQCAEDKYDDRHMYELAVSDLVHNYLLLEYIELLDVPEKLLETPFRFVVDMAWTEFFGGKPIYCSRHLEHIEN